VTFAIVDGELATTLGGPEGHGTVSVAPSGLATFGVENKYTAATGRASFNTQGDLRIGFSALGLSADAAYNPWQSKFDLSLSLGGPPAPISAPGYQGSLLSELSQTATRGVAGATNLAIAGPGEWPGMIRRHPLRSDVRAVIGAVSAGRTIADVPRNPASPDIRLRFNLSYSPLVAPAPSSATEPPRPTGGLTITGTLMMHEL